MAGRELTPNEERFIKELGLDRDAFLGVRFTRGEHGISRSDPYFLVERTSLALDQPVAPQIHGLELSRNFRFGNHMVALSQILFIAQKLNIPQVFLPEHPLFRTDFVVEGVRFTQSLPADHQSTLRGRFFLRHTFEPLLDGVFRPAEFFHRFRGAILPLSGDGALDALRVNSKLCWRSIVKRFSNELTVHIRSGDIFEKENPHPGYWQPPLDYYTEAIDQENPRTVTLVFENTANPVIPPLLEWLNLRDIQYRLADGPIEEAIRELFTARKVVAGRGSFLAPVMALSGSLRKLTAFSDNRYFDLPQMKDMHAGRKEKIRLTVVPAGDYRPLVSPWRNSLDQRDLMLRYKLSSDQKAALRAK